MQNCLCIWKKLKLKKKNETPKQILLESMKCHHNDFANYIYYDFEQDERKSVDDLYTQNFKYYNFLLLENKFITDSIFMQLCKYDYYFFVYMLLKETDIDINKQI